jgi:hypothetical protein
MGSKIDGLQNSSFLGFVLGYAEEMFIDTALKCSDILLTLQ